MKRSKSVRYAILVVILVVGAAALYAIFAAHDVRNRYLAFSQAQSSYETAAYKPAVRDNPVRQEIGYLLSQVLQVKMSDAQRLDDAKQGVEYIKTIEAEVDDIKTQGDVAGPLLQKLDHEANSPATLRSAGKLREIVAIGKRQAQIIADIRGLSYRADYYSREVFERIIDEQGSLSPEHVTYLNDLLPQLESQFNQRENLYTELKSNSDKMHALAHELGYE